MSGFGMCCGCGGGTPTYLPCSGINCSGTDYLLCDMPNVYRADLSAVTTDPAFCCVEIGDTINYLYLWQGNCLNYQNFDGRNDPCCNSATTCNGTNAFGGAMLAWCGGTFGGYVLTEPCFVLEITGAATCTGWVAYYICPLAGYNCSGANVFDLVAETGSPSIVFPATLTLTPLATPACRATC